MKKIAVVIPTYKEKVNYLESFSLKTLNQHLGDYPTIVFKPKSQKKIPSLIADRKIISFDDQYFESVQGYSQLLLTSHFYEQFLDYEYILIYQFDCLVLSDQLTEWVKKDYDYIGAPWLFSLTAFVTHPQGKMSLSANGGFCLRKVKIHYQVLKKLEEKYPQRGNGKEIFWQQLKKLNTRKYWLTVQPQDYPFNEDGFFVLEASKVVPFKLPSIQTAAKFAIEKHPRLLRALNGNQIPFGVHAWYRYQPKYWLPYLNLSKNEEQKLLDALEK